jgi:hypothetical protein
MRKKQFVSVVLVLFLALTVGTGRSYAQVQGAVSAASALGTGFTYQGQLKNSGDSPITAICDFNFRLWDAASSGAEIGSSSAVNGVNVVNGYFTTQVNSGGEFGANAFNGEARWLGIEVKCTGDASYIALSPLQPVTPAPYALALPGLYTQPNATSPNIIGGFSGNSITTGKFGSTISGGGTSGYINQINGNYATIGGGEVNTANASSSTVSGGSGNTAGGVASSVGGGGTNTAGGSFSTVSGGASNTASGYGGAIPGGIQNTAEGLGSFAAGRQAKAKFDGDFVWADATAADFASTAANQFLVRAGGGVGINTTSTTANNLTVNGQVIAGGTTAPSGSEPFVSEGSASGIGMDDRLGGTNPRWVIFPNNGVLTFGNSTYPSVAWLSDAGGLSLATFGSSGTNTLCTSFTHVISLCSSSLRYKNNVADLTMGLDTISKLRPVTFNWKDSGEPDLGLVAEEVDKITPLLTTRNDNGQIEGVKYDRISALLVKGMQEQQQQIADLQAQVKALKQGKATSPFATPWPWLALTVLGGLLILKRKGGRI